MIASFQPRPIPPTCPACQARMKLVLVVGVERRAYKCQDCARQDEKDRAIESASVAACDSGLCCFALGSAMMYAAASYEFCPWAERLDLRRVGTRASKGSNKPGCVALV